MFKTKGNKKEKGQGLVEYALILVLVAIVVIAVLMLLGPIIGGVFSTINDSLSGVGGGGGVAAVVPTDPPAPCASTPAFESWKTSLQNTCNSQPGNDNSVWFTCNPDANVTSATCWYGGDGFNTPHPLDMGTFTH
jgi:pilus assembly protein Flp/PilA